MDTLLKWSGKTSDGIRKHVVILALTSAVLFLHNLTIFPTNLSLENLKNASLLDEDSEKFLIQLNKEINVSKFLNQTIFLFGAALGFFIGWILCQKLSPKRNLLINLSLNFIFILINGVLAHRENYGLEKHFSLVIRFLVGTTFSISYAAIFVLFLDWAHVKNQVFAINHAFGWRFVSFLLLGLLSIVDFNWGYFLYIEGVFLILMIVLNAIFVQESPRWYRKNEKHYQFRRLAFDLAARIKFDKKALHGKLLKEAGEKPIPLPHLENKKCILLQIVNQSTMREKIAKWELAFSIFSTINAFTSMVIQYSSVRIWSWTTEIFVLACLQFLAYCISMPFFRLKQKTLVITIMVAGFLSVLLQVIPNGTISNLLLQLAKCVTLLLDHFYLFYALNVCLPPPIRVLMPVEAAPTRFRPTFTAWPNTMDSARLRAKLLLVAEGFACFSRTLAIFFVLEIPSFLFSAPTKTSEDSNAVADVPPKFLFCAICYSAELMVLIVGNAVCCMWPSNLQPQTSELSGPQKPRSILRHKETCFYRTRRPISSEIEHDEEKVEFEEEVLGAQIFVHKETSTDDHLSEYDNLD